MGKALNVFAKGLKIAGHVALGSLAYGLSASAANWHPNPATPVGFIWNTVGITVATGAIAAMFRFAQYDPAKVGK